MLWRSDELLLDELVEFVELLDELFGVVVTELLGVLTAGFAVIVVVGLVTVVG